MAEENLTTNKENISANETNNIDNNPGFVKSIRTLENDIADYTKEKNFSVLDIVAEEVKVRGLSFENPETEEGFFSKYKKNIAVLVSAIIILAGGYFGVSRLLERNMSINNSMLDKITEGPILADNRIEVEVETYQGKKDIFLGKMEDALGEDNVGAKLTEISLVKSDSGRKISMDKEDLFTVAGIYIPQNLEDFLDKEFMLLNFKNDGDYPVLVFKTDSYNYVFSEMLKWESKMLESLDSVFPQSDFTGEDVFIDKYIQNHDARVLENNSEINLIYSFVDRKYLIVTNNEDALTEVFKRFTSVKYTNPKAEW